MHFITFGKTLQKMDFPFDSVFPETVLAYRAITQAASKVLEIYGGAFEATEKADKSPVTLADLESHRIISDVLSESKITVVSEEGEQQGRMSDRFWLVDPLDGTKEFVDRNGEFTIMIALVEGGRPSIGVISHPLAGDVYVAQRGHGAFRLTGGQWSRLGVSSTKSLNQSSAVISRSHVSAEELDFIQSLGLVGHSRLGSSLKALRICSGGAELYFAANSKMKQWDTGASHCLVSESGGRITDMFGGDIVYSSGAQAHEKGIVMSNGFVHDEFIEKCVPFRAKQFASK